MLIVRLVSTQGPVVESLTFMRERDCLTVKNISAHLFQLLSGTSPVQSITDICTFLFNIIDPDRAYFIKQSYLAQKIDNNSRLRFTSWIGGLILSYLHFWRDRQQKSGPQTTNRSFGHFQITVHVKQKWNNKWLVDTSCPSWWGVHTEHQATSITIWFFVLFSLPPDHPHQSHLLPVPLPF